MKEMDFPTKGEKYVQVCRRGECGGECYRCRCRRLSLRVDTLENDLEVCRNLSRGLEAAAGILRSDKAGILEVLGLTFPILAEAAQSGDSHQRLVRDLVETTIEAHTAHATPDKEEGGNGSAPV
jgi:hypothetical protein